MSLLFRFFWVVLQAYFSKRKLHFFDESLIHLYVLPTDLDLNMHMNNGRYLTIMDLGRTDLMIRAGLAKPILDNKWYPVVGSILSTFRSSLNPFDKYTLHTRLIGWDDKWFYIEQKFTKRGTVAMVGIVKALFRNKHETIPTKKIIASIAPGLESPTLPDSIQKWLDAEKFFALSKKESK